MLKALDRQWLDLTTPLGKGILAFLSALAEDERARMERENEALSSVPDPNSRPINSARPHRCIDPFQQLAWIAICSLTWLLLTTSLAATSSALMGIDHRD
jgi:hypothetical protein